MLMRPKQTEVVPYDLDADSSKVMLEEFIECPDSYCLTDKLIGIFYLYYLQTNRFILI